MLADHSPNITYDIKKTVPMAETKPNTYRPKE